MLKFKGQTERGTWVEFNISQIGGVAGDYIAVYIHHDYFVDPDTIQLADDPRKNILDEAKYKIEHPEAGPPVELYRKGYYSAVIEALQILDEMEAKL